MESLWHKPVQTQVLHLLPPVLVLDEFSSAQPCRVQAQVFELLPPVLVLDGQLEPNGIHVHLHLEVGLEELFHADPGNIPVLQ